MSSTSPPSPLQGRHGHPRPRRRMHTARTLVDPAAKAYLVGYLLDLVPCLLKIILRFATREAKRITALQRRAHEERIAKQELGPDRITTAGLSTWDDFIAPTLRGLPRMARDALTSAMTALGPQGMAAACAAAMLGWGVLDEVLAAVVLGTGIGKSGPTSSARRLARQQTVRVWTCFLAAALSSATSLMLLQTASTAADTARRGGKNPLLVLSSPDSLYSSSRSSLGNLKRSVMSRLSASSSTPPRTTLLPTPLAPGGHFLARFTSLSISPSPNNNGSRSPEATFKPLSPASVDAPMEPLRKSTSPIPSSSSSSSKSSARASTTSSLGKPSPTIDLTLFALVRGLDTLVRSAPLFAGYAASKVNGATQKSAKIIGRGRSRESLGEGLGQRRQRMQAAGEGLLYALRAGLSNQAEGITFVLCCAVIMWSWFYHPERLPPTYVKWITNLATMDERLLLALRCIRNGKPYTWEYQDIRTTPQAVDLLGSLSESLGYPYEWGDPTRLPASAADARRLLNEAKAEHARALAAAAQGGSGASLPREDPHRPTNAHSVPGYVLSGASGPRGRGEMGGIPCELVHCGVGGSSCLANAGLRWARGWKVCMGIYVPVHLLPRLMFNPRQFTKEPAQAVWKVLTGSARSASFLATYIASIWYMVCLGRTFLLPRLFPSLSHRFWDRGLGPLMGSFACGLAIFIEERRKRAEMALYVAPRALYALAESARPGWLSTGERTARWAETVVFGLAVGIVITAARFRPEFLRGVTSIMAWVVKRRVGAAAAAAQPAPAARA